MKTLLGVLVLVLCGSLAHADDTRWYRFSDKNLTCDSSSEEAPPIKSLTSKEGCKLENIGTEVQDLYILNCKDTELLYVRGFANCSFMVDGIKQRLGKGEVRRDLN